MGTNQAEQKIFTYRIEDGVKVCNHDYTVTEKACCSVAGPSGYIECGCNGQDEVYCENPDCTGLDPDDLPEFNNDCWG